MGEDGWLLAANEHAIEVTDQKRFQRQNNGLLSSVELRKLGALA